MPSMTSDQLRDYEQRQLESARRKTINQSHNSRPTPVLESSAGNVPLATSQGQGQVGERVLIRFTSVRRRLLDEDNICSKYYCDFCRYAGLIQSDAPDKTHIEIRQRKCEDGEIEHTEILIFESENQN